MSEKTKRSRSIYTVNEKTKSEIHPTATSPALSPTFETSSQSSHNSGDKGDFQQPVGYRTYGGYRTSTIDDYGTTRDKSSHSEEYSSDYGSARDSKSSTFVNYGGSYDTTTVYKTTSDKTSSRDRKLVDYTPEWRKAAPQVGSCGDFERDASMEVEYLGFDSPPVSSEMLLAAKHQENSRLLSTMIRDDYVKPGMAIATPHGTMSLRLRNDIKVDLTLDSSIRLINKRNSIVIALNPYGCTSALIHPHGRILQTGSKVEMLIMDSINGNNKNAKMWFKGVSFNSDASALVYLVDAAGTRSTTDTFRDLNPDFSLSVFYDEARHGSMFVQETVAILQKATYRVSAAGVEHWRIKDVNISQSGDVVSVYRSDGKYSLKLTGASQTAMLTTPFIHCTASAEHVFVRRGDRRMHFDGANFIVRNAGHSAGFDEENELKIF